METKNANYFIPSVLKSPITVKSKKKERVPVLSASSSTRVLIHDCGTWSAALLAVSGGVLILFPVRLELLQGALCGCSGSIVLTEQ